METTSANPPGFLCHQYPATGHSGENRRAKMNDEIVTNRMTVLEEAVRGLVSIGWQVESIVHNAKVYAEQAMNEKQADVMPGQPS